MSREIINPPFAWYPGDTTYPANEEPVKSGRYKLNKNQRTKRRYRHNPVRKEEVKP